MGGCHDAPCAQEAADILGEMEDLQERVSSAQAGQSKAETESTALRRQLAVAKAQVISTSRQPGFVTTLLRVPFQVCGTGRVHHTQADHSRYSRSEALVHGVLGCVVMNIRHHRWHPTHIMGRPVLRECQIQGDEG